MTKIALISCGKKKRSEPCPARQMYTSPLFREAVKFAERVADNWYILSAKHGLLEKDKVIEPYEESLRGKPRNEREQWVSAVIKALSGVVTSGDEISVLAGEAYAEALADRLRQMGCTVSLPLKGLALGKRLQYLQHYNSTHNLSAEANRYHKQLELLRQAENGGRLFRECSGRIPWPTRGLYLIFEPGEFRFHSDQQRIVRIGTHGVSVGSKSTLWNRLSAHKGTGDGVGNHRSSIFRLHVGAAIIARSQGRLVCATWGIGQHASRDILDAEADIERMVSKHIGEMRVLWLNIPDRAGPDSDRAFLERNLIALLTPTGKPLEPPSREWLGFHRPQVTIRNSGLWNLNHVGERYDPRALDVFAEYVACVTEDRPPPSQALAPIGWRAERRVKISHEQLALF